MCAEIRIIRAEVFTTVLIAKIYNYDELHFITRLPETQGFSEYVVFVASVPGYSKEYTTYRIAYSWILHSVKSYLN